MFRSRRFIHVYEVIFLSGHSKWANIKHRKAAQDAKRGNLFQKLVRAIIIAAKEGGGDPAMNMRLKTAIPRSFRSGEEEQPVYYFY